MLDEIALAETLGFGECWFAEHHFTDYSLLPSPNLMIASAIPRTRRMRFGNYVNALSFHHPLRLAAEAAMLDNLARGRFDFGVGKGVRPGEFAQLGIKFEDGVPMTEESIEIILKVWTEERTSPTRAGSGASPSCSLRPRVYPASPSAAPRGGEPAGLGRASRRARLARGDALHADGDRGPERRGVSRGARPAQRARGHRPISAAARAVPGDLCRRDRGGGPGRGSAGAPGLLASLLAGRPAAAGRILR